MSQMKFPSFNEYQAALQNPAICFDLPELKNSSVEGDLWGLPRVRSGGFALTYKLTGRNGSWAVRCFHRHVADRATRYHAISDFLMHTASNVLLPIRYLNRGIQVRGDWFPITCMKWVEGETLEAYLAKNIQHPEQFSWLPDEFRRVVSELERLQISHGDLSHRNLMVNDHHLSLVDYDGMYVPALSGRKSAELGNVHFQQPGRTPETFHAQMDRFSSIVIYLALQALALNPELWNRYEAGGEGLLFQRDDFLHPYQSPLLQELETFSNLRSLIGQFRSLCTCDVERIPRLDDFIQNRPLTISRREAGSFRPGLASPARVFNASNRFTLMQQLGKVVTVIGKCSEVFRGATRDGQPHVFVNFGMWQGKCFTIVLWADALQLLEQSGKDPQALYLNRWVSVTGVLTSYNRRPQIAVNLPTDLQVLSPETAALRLGETLNPKLTRPGQPALWFNPRPAAGQAQPFRGIPQSTFDRLASALDLSREAQNRLEKLYANQNAVKKEDPNQDVL